jgi:uncharacterized protein (TIGR02246 family)
VAHENSDQDTVEACLERIRLAWNAGDAHAYAREFTEDATYVVYLGDPLLGRAAIEQNHVPVLTRWQKGTQMAIEPIAVQHLGTDAASVLTVGGIGRGRRIELDKVQTYTLVRHNGRWACVAFQNTKMSRRTRRRYNQAPATGVLAVLRRWKSGWSA